MVGARGVHVVANLGGPQGYLQNPGDILAIWHGGLSSFGGLLGGVPTGLYCARRWCPQLRLSVALDLVAPVLVIAWTVGRLLGPQLMYQGGGNQTHAWYGMAYAGQAGKRVPVPIIQAIEDACRLCRGAVGRAQDRAARRARRHRRHDRGHPLRRLPLQRRVRALAAQHRGRHRGHCRLDRLCRLRGRLSPCYLWRRDRGSDHPAGVDPWAAPAPGAPAAGSAGGGRPEAAAGGDERLGAEEARGRRPLSGPRAAKDRAPTRTAC